MVANLENTVRKWRAVYNALGRSSKISMRGGAFVLSKNAPALNQMFKNYEQAHARINNRNLTTNQEARNYFQIFPNQRQYITEAYNKLPNVNNQLNKVAHKIIAARKIQKISRSAVQKRNKKEKNNTMRSALLVARTLPRNMARREILGKIYHNLHVSKTAYGPKTEINASRNYRTYSKYPTY